MWDYLNGSWRITAPPDFTGTFVFNRSKKTVYHKATQQLPTRVLPSERTDRGKFYRKGSTEIITLIIDNKGVKLESRIVLFSVKVQTVWYGLS